MPNRLLDLKNTGFTVLSLWHQPPAWLMRVGIAFFFGLLVILIAVPVVFSPSESVLGNNVDVWIFYWNNWWLEKAFEEGINILHTPYLFAPEGTSLIPHSNSFTGSLLAYILSPVLDPVTAYNSVILFGLWIGAVGMYFFVLSIADNHAAALFAGFAFTLAPYHITQALAHGHLGGIHWWPYFALYLRRLLNRSRWTDAAAAGVFLALTFWTGMQLALYIFMWTIFYVLWWVISTILQRKVTTVRLLSIRNQLIFVGNRAMCLIITGVIALLLMAPMLLPMIYNWDNAWTMNFDRGEIDQTDLLAYVVPPTYNPFLGKNVNYIYERFVANRAFMPYIGVAVTLLVCIAVMDIKRNFFWFFISGLWIVLAAGSVLRINGQLFQSIRLPYLWLSKSFPFSALRAPDRFNLLLVFSISILVGYGAKRIRKQKWIILLGLLMFIEYIPVPVLHWNVPETSQFYDDIAEDPADYSVLDVPLGYTSSKLWLYHQTLHNKPIVEGHISRYSADPYKFMVSNSILSNLYLTSLDDLPSLLTADEFRDRDTHPPGADLGPALRDLRDHGVRYIFIHEPYINPETRHQIRNILPLTPVHRDKTLTVYDLRTPLLSYYDDMPHDLSAEAKLTNLVISPGIEDQTWQVTLQLEAVEDSFRDLDCQIQLTDGDGVVYLQPLVLFRKLSDDRIWRIGDLMALENTVTINKRLRTGSYHWRFGCEYGNYYQYPDTLIIDNDGNSKLIRDFVQIEYGEIIQLDSYRWFTEDAYLRLELTWKALNKPGDELMTFVHLLDEGGAIQAQYDAIPCEWTCPTQTWQVDEKVVDLATLDLSNLPSGNYSLAVGLFNPTNGERLEVNELNGNDYVILPDEFTITNINE